MAQTLVSDIIVPEVFLPYVIERTAELSAFVQSGIIADDAQFAALAAQGGQTQTMPFWTDINTPDSVIDDLTPLSTDNIVTSEDVSIIHNRGRAWSVNDLAGLMAGSDPARAIQDLVAAYWARRANDMIFAFLEGVFSASDDSMEDLVLTLADGTATPDETNTLNGKTFIDACQLLGDNKEKLSAVGMHSATEASLNKQDLIDFLPDSTGKELVKVFQNKRVILDDSCPVNTNNEYPVYTTYLFGEGAIALGADSRILPVEGAAPGSTWNVEFARVALAGTSVLINRRRFIMHLRGVKWNGAVMAGKSPTNAELANGENWSRVYEVKNIRVIAVQHVII